jgi:hypothetical protein
MSNPSTLFSGRPFEASEDAVFGRALQAFRSVKHYSVKETFRLSTDFFVFVIEGIVVRYLFQEEKNKKIRRQSE